MPVRRRQRNIINKVPKAIAQPKNEKKVLNDWSRKKFYKLFFFIQIETYEKYEEICTRYAIQQACFQWTS